MLVATGVIISAAAGFFLLPRVAAHKVDKSIAVLPFENLSDEKENAYFADGIQDDVLTNLSKIGDLKVISRTSVMQYRGKADRTFVRSARRLVFPIFSKAAFVASGNKVRVNVQLIDANTDEHIWAEDYDRDVTDVFAIQSDLAQQDRRMRCRPNCRRAEKIANERKPTENGEAYLAFVQAHNLSLRLEDLEQTQTERAALPARDRFGSKLCARDCALLAIGKLDCCTTSSAHRNGAKRRAL